MYCPTCGKTVEQGCTRWDCQVPGLEQKRMTREEAYVKLAEKGCEVRYGAKGQGDVIVALEALGLLKFDEVKEMKLFIIEGENNNSVHTIDQIKEALKGFYKLEPC